jgi:hypothetical protein
VKPTAAARTLSLFDKKTDLERPRGQARDGLKHTERRTKSTAAPAPKWVDRYGTWELEGRRATALLCRKDEATIVVTVNDTEHAFTNLFDAARFAERAVAGGAR